MPRQPFWGGRPRRAQKIGLRMQGDWGLRLELTAGAGLGVCTSPKPYQGIPEPTLQAVPPVRPTP